MIPFNRPEEKKQEMSEYHFVGGRFHTMKVYPCERKVKYEGKYEGEMLMVGTNWFHSLVICGALTRVYEAVQKLADRGIEFHTFQGEFGGREIWIPVEEDRESVLRMLFPNMYTNLRIAK